MTDIVLFLAGMHTQQANVSAYGVPTLLSFFLSPRLNLFLLILLILLSSKTLLSSPLLSYCHPFIIKSSSESGQNGAIPLRALKLFPFGPTKRSHVPLIAVPGTD